jgi:hypothetical protein
VPKSASAAAGAGELADQLELGPQDGHQYQLRDPVSDINSKALATAIPTGHEKLALVIGIDEPYEVSQDDAVLMAEP